VLAEHAQPGSLTGCLLLANLAADALEETDARGEEAAADTATRLAEAALREDHLLGAGQTDVAMLASITLVATDRLDTAWHTWNAELDRARRRGSVVGFAHASNVRAYLAYRRGQLAEAEADAALADHLAREHHLDLMRRHTLAILVGALVERGEARAAAERIDTAHVAMNLPLLLDSRGRLRSAQGRYADAVEDFRECGRKLAARGTHHPGVLAWRSNTALALLHLDQPREARRLAEEELDLARRLGVPRALGIALRTTGLVHGGPAGLTQLEQAAAVLGAEFGGQRQHEGDQPAQGRTGRCRSRPARFPGRARAGQPGPPLRRTARPDTRVRPQRGRPSGRVHAAHARRPDHGAQGRGLPVA
jgi:tetratricopeptide (TPR) repeat protein